MDRYVSYKGAGTTFLPLSHLKIKPLRELHRHEPIPHPHLPSGAKSEGIPIGTLHLPPTLEHKSPSSPKDYEFPLFLVSFHPQILVHQGRERGEQYCHWSSAGCGLQAKRFMFLGNPVLSEPQQQGCDSICSTSQQKEGTINEKPFWKKMPPTWDMARNATCHAIGWTLVNLVLSGISAAQPEAQKEFSQ